MPAEAADRAVNSMEESPPSRLLILRCSSRKQPGTEPIPALDRYDGPAFRVLRKYLRSEPSDPPLIQVLSAEHGLVPVEQMIEEYDRRMTPERAQELRPEVLETLRMLLLAQPVREVMVVVGQIYLQALDGIEQVIGGLPLRVARETQGRKLGALRAWLYRDDAAKATVGLGRQPRSEPRQLSLVRSAAMGFRVGGKSFTTSTDQVLGIARRAIVEGDKEATRINRWYVPIDGSRVAPKWLVATVSGTSTRDFQADAARSVLERLGIPVIEIGTAHDGRS